MNTHNIFKFSRKGLLMLAVASAAANAQEVNESEAEAQTEAAEVIMVKGYRGSLLTSAAAKRDSQGFVDEVFADDIGKMPSQNLAESLSRIPGVKINRDVTGEGQQISVRGLGPGFTKIALNGNAMAIASTGALGAGNRNREVDLDMFPTELFSSLAVSKTATASQLEGGVSGYVNMRTARPFDSAGERFKFSLEGAYNDLAESVDPKYSAVYSNTFDKFGVLVGVVGSKATKRVDGYEATVLYTDGCVAKWDNPERTASSCVEGSEGLNHFFWSPEATADYAAAHPGVNVGDPVDPIATSGLSAQALDTANVPYLGRPMFTSGDTDKFTSLVSLQYRPNDDMDIVLDLMYGEANKDFVRTEAMWWGRRNYLHQGAAMIPENLTVADNGYLESGTFYNAHVWVGSHDYKEELDFVSVMPSLSWQLTDMLKMDVSASMTESNFFRDEPYAYYMAPAGTLTYKNDGTVPSFGFSHDPSDPDIGWTWAKEYDQNGDGSISSDEKFGNTFLINQNKRETETQGFHLDFAYGEAPDFAGFKFGLAWDKNSNSMRSFGGSSEFYQQHIVGSGVIENFGDYITDPVVDDLGKVIDGYNAYSGIAQLDWNKFYQATNYAQFEPIEGAGDQFGQSAGDIEEEVLGVYFEANAETEVAGRLLRMNTGVRWVDTKQKVATMNAATEADYSKLLPSMSLVYEVHDDVKLRASASRSLTRANPSDMYPNAAWSSSGVESARAGNPYLSPFEATNFDIGGEWYFSELGYLGVTYFEKEVTGFTESGTVSVPFLELPGYGLDIENLGDSRAESLEQCGGAENCTTLVTTLSNINSVAKLSGFEAVLVMPLDFVVDGLGFNASATTINSSAQDPRAMITGIADWTYNVTGFYENEDFQARLTYYHQDGSTNWFSVFDRPVMSMDRTQVDFSASYNLPLEYDLTLTFDAYNLTNEQIGSWYEYSGVTYDVFYSGTTYTLGIRGSF
ncbi:TonB-dependent receptor [Catenovulum agarivorans]|uniref:TonB-dependent receptor n=1 Tax=Catenovulum agarivorans TaxID=1172192 RepID=UPI0002DC6DD3|nr:TonB-dependent receptor [Catenovulum agarivorans]